MFYEKKCDRARLLSSLLKRSALNANHSHLEIIQYLQRRHNHSARYFTLSQAPLWILPGYPAQGAYPWIGFSEFLHDSLDHLFLGKAFLLLFLDEAIGAE